MLGLRTIIEIGLINRNVVPCLKKCWSRNVQLG